MRQILLKLGRALPILGCLLLGRLATAQNQGFSLNRYEPTAAGEWSFMVDHPWYSGTRYFAAGLTLNYAHDPLVFNVANQSGPVSSQTLIIEHQLMAHVDLAGSFLDRVLVAASLPIDLLEKGNAIAGVTPIGSPAVSDPRVGARVRLWGQPYKDPFAISIGADVWIPINLGHTFPDQVGESGVRVLPKLILGGLTHHILWSVTGGFYYRPDQSVGGQAPGFGNTAGSELQAAAAIAYADLERRFAVGIESSFHTVVTGDQRFLSTTTGLEILGGVHYNIVRLIQLSVAGGAGVLRDPGTPDARVLLRLAYAPFRKPPPPDRDRDGVLDPQDGCPDEPQGPNPDPARPGCPLRDTDGDGVYDRNDQCVREPAGSHPDPARPGCPLRDTDGDGILDSEDQCVSEPAGAHPDPKRLGCPLRDRDGDAVFDDDDQCPDTPAGPQPDPTRPGCPDTDRDKDSVPDRLDRCPDEPGVAPSGCPERKYVVVSAEKIELKRQIHFATNKSKILPDSYELLDEVVEVMQKNPQIKKLRIEGHTDNKGAPAKNLLLSQSRAKAVYDYLLTKKIDAARLESTGLGQTCPIASNSTETGREKNRRTDFYIVVEGQSVTRGCIQEAPPAPKGKPAAKPKATGKKK